MDEMESSGGYEYEFIAIPPDRVLCKICQNPCRDAYLTGCCGTNFCHSCLQQLKKQAAVNKSCPMCREEKFKIFPNKGLDREIKSLSIYCENRKGGCTWSGEINDMKKHITADCQFVEIACPSKCGVKLKRQCVQQHVAKECPCHCQYCGATGTKEEIAAKHKTRCPQYPLPCPNGCQLGVVPSGGMVAHRKVCPLELVQCEYYVVGCESLVSRRDLENHYSKKVAEHLSLMKSKFASTNKALAESEKKLTTIGKELAVTRKALNSTKTRYDELAGMAGETEAELRWLVDEEYLNTKSDLMHLRVTTAMQYDQAMSASVYLNATFTRFNSCMLAMMMLFMFMYISQFKLVNERLAQTEQYSWPKTLDYVSGLSTLNGEKTVPFIFKVWCKDLNQARSWANITFHPSDGEYEILMAVDYSMKDDSVVVSLFKRKLEEIGEWPLKALFITEVLNQFHNNDHYIIPVLINTDFDKTCHLSNDEIVVCKVHVIYGQQLSDQYLINNSVYFRISQISYKEGVWNLYNWFGATIFNFLLSYKVLILWTAIGTVGVMAFFTYHGAWLGAKPTIYIVFLSMFLIALSWRFTPP